MVIEYNGYFWHRNQKKNKKYDYCLKNNIDFMIIWEHKEEEWKEILKRKILWEKFEDDILFLENIYYQNIYWYEKIWKEKQKFEFVKKYKIWNLWKTVWRKIKEE